MASSEGQPTNHKSQVTDLQQNVVASPGDNTATWQQQPNEISSSPSNIQDLDEKKLSYAQACQTNIPKSDEELSLTSSNSRQKESQEHVATDQRHCKSQSHSTYNLDNNQKPKEFESATLSGNGQGQIQAKDATACGNKEQLNQKHPSTGFASSSSELREDSNYQSGSFNQRVRYWENQSKETTEAHYNNLRQRHMATDKSSEIALNADLMNKHLYGQEFSTESEGEEDSKEESTNNTQKEENALKIVFNVLTPSAKKVWVELYIDGKIYSYRLEKIKDNHWRSATFYFLPDEFETVRYRYVITFSTWLPFSSQELQEVGQRTLSSRVNQYDVFKDPGDKNFFHNHFQGQLYYLNDMFLSVNEGSVKDFLLDCEHLGLTKYTLTAQQRREFFELLKVCTQKQLSPYQSMFITVLLGRVVSQQRLNYYEKFSTSCADSLLESIHHCDDSLLPSNSVQYLEAAACVIVPASSSPGYLCLLANFCSLIPTPRLLLLAKERCMNTREEFNLNQSILIDRFLRSCEKLKSNSDCDLMRFIISRNQSLSFLLCFYEKLRKRFQPNQERDKEFLTAFTRHIEDNVSMLGTKPPELLQHWDILDERLRHSLSIEFNRVVLKKLNGPSSWWEKKRVQNLSAFFQKEEIWSGTEMFPIVQHLCNSDSDELGNLFLQLLCSTVMSDWWSNLKEEERKRLCIKWLQSEIKKRQRWRMSEKWVIELLKDLKALFDTRQVKQDDILKDSLGDYIRERMREIDLEYVLDSFHVVEKMPSVSRYYVQFIIDAVHTKKDRAVRNIKSVLRTFERGESSNRNSVGIFVPELAEDIVLSAMEMTEPDFTEDAKKYNLEDCVVSVFEHRDLWFSYLGAKGHVTRLKQHSKLIRIRECLQQFADAISTRCVRLGFIEDLLKMIKPSSGEEKTKEILATVFASFFCEVVDSHGRDLNAWKNVILDYCELKKRCEKKLRRVSFIARYCQSLELPTKDQEHWLSTTKKLVETMPSMCLGDLEKDDRWMTVEKVAESAEGIFQLNASHVFRIVAKRCLKLEMKYEENSMCVEDVVNILNTKGIEEFQKVCNPLFHEKAEIPVSQACVYWKDFGNKKSLDQELSFIEKYFKRGRVNHKTKAILLNYLKLPDLLQKVQKTMRLVRAFGLDENNQSEFLQALHHFEKACNSKSSTIDELSEIVKTVADIEDIFEDENFRDVASELAFSRDLIDFVKEVANEDIRVLIDAVEEHSDQSVSESTVSDLIELHRFLRSTLKNKSLSSKELLESLKKSFESLSNKSGMAARIKSCSCNVHSLRGLYLNVANRGEVTKEIVANAVKKGRYVVVIQPDQEPRVYLTYNRQDGNEAVYSLADLYDLRSRALLILNADKKPSNFCDTRPVEFGAFVQQIDAVTEILHTLSKLQSSGNPQFRKFWKVLESIEDTKKLERHLQEEFKKWERVLELARKKYFYLNYFYSDQFWKIYNFFAGNAKNSKENMKKEVCSLLRYVDPMVTIEDMDCMFDLFKKPKSNQDLENSLCNLGAFLEEIFKSRRTASEVVKIKTTIASAKNIKETVKQGQIFVAVLEPNTNIAVNVVMSLFRNVTGCPPKPNKVLFCHQGTVWDEVSLFLHRCFMAPNFGIRSELHCIVNVENLSNEIQFDLVEEIKKLKEESLLNNNASFLLSLVCCGGDHHHIVDQFFEFKHHVSGMTDVELTEYFSSSFPNVEMITSDLPGLGKTERIRDEAASNKRGVLTVPISGPISRQALVKQLCTLKLRTFESLHFDVGEVDDAQFLDVFLFQLIVTGMVSSGTTFYHLPTTYVFIEIANTLHQWLRDSFSICKCFNRVHVNQGIGEKLKVSEEVTSSVQVVCHYLDTYEKGLLEQKDLLFSGSTQLKPLSQQRCCYLLSKHFSVTGDMSFTILEIFLNVLANQLMKFSTSQYFRTANLKVMLKGDHDVRTQLFRSLLDVSQEFASRSVFVCRSEQSEAVTKKSASEILEKMQLQIGNTAEQMVDRVKGMIQWADSNHLMVVFNSLDSHTISALYRNVEKVPVRVQELFKGQALNKKLEDLSTLTQKELQEKLNRIVRTSPPPKNNSLDALSYALTPDNVLKMALIIQRVRANIPVIVMGETGCGKTSLIRYLAKTCEVPFHVFNFHAGIQEENIVAFLSKLTEEARKSSRPKWVFLDEINTCEYLGMINDLICHRMFCGKPLPPNLVFMAACNPYRIRPSEQIETAGLSGKFVVDEYSKLVYRVHPLPETMIDYVWDYGSLHASDEEAYIARMVETLFNNQHLNLLVRLLTASQAFIRQIEKSPYCVSLRDVNRCKILITWFYDSLKKRPPLDPVKTESHLKKYQSVTQNFNNEYRSIVLALAHCYQSRLPTAKTRKEYRKKMTDIFQAQAANEVSSMSASQFEAIVRLEQEEYLARMELPEGTAKNAALRENVFVILVCILNRIPVFVVGKPGCSKSLSMQVIRSNLRGRDSIDDFFRNLPQLYVVSHQGSESSTSEGIIKVFEKARKYREKNEEGVVLPVVLLDEIGLAEISKYNPLKVLHSLLEPEDGHFPDVAVVGISNWSLDAAKMNRAIHLSRPEPDVEDLRETGLSIRDANSYKLSQAGDYLNPTVEQSLPFCFPSDRQLECLAKAYYHYIATQKYANFHGLRDYYSLVKSLSTQRAVEFDEFTSEETSSELIQTSVQRNFGGIRNEESNIQKVFMKNMPDCAITQKPITTASLIAENLHDRLARHLMLITAGDSAIGLLNQTLHELDKETITIFGSAFEEDLSDEYNYRILSRIILCMERDCVLILRDLESIYGSLYDMLNQNYTVVGGKKNCRVALGAYSNPMCQVHDGFRCIVLVDQHKVDYADPPFLNRFEKQLLRFSDVIKPDEKAVISTLQAWVEDFSTISHLNAQFSVSETFAGFHEDTLPSLVLQHQSDSITKEELLEVCKKDLLRVASPDGILRALGSKLANEEPLEVSRLYEEYFSLPIHGGISNYVLFELEENMNTTDLKLFVMTHSNIHSDVSKLLKGVVKCQLEKLSSFKSEKNLTARLESFWLEPETDMLVIQCAPNLDAQHMLLMKSIVEQQRKDFLSQVIGQERKLRKHVCVVIHMQRENQEDLHPWQFNFLSGWKQVMIDVLEEPSFSLNNILGNDIIDVLDSNDLAFGKIAIDQILWCFTCIKYTSKERSLEGVLNLVQQLTFSEIIFLTFKELVKQWIIDQTSCDEIFQIKVARPWQISVACDRQALINSSTLVGAMQHYVTHLVRQPLAIIVFFLEKESAWPRSLLDCEAEDQDELNEWRNLLLDKEIFNMDEIATPRGAEFYEVHGKRLDLKFPFSTVMKKKVDEVKTFFMDDLQKLQFDEDNIDHEGELKMDVSIHQIERFSFIVKQKAPQLFQSKWALEHTDAYLEDVLDIASAEIVPDVSRVQRVKLLKSECACNLVKLERDAPLLVTEIHSILWKKTSLLAAELELFKVSNSLAADKLEAVFQKYTKHFQELNKTQLNIYQVSDEVNLDPAEQQQNNENESKMESKDTTKEEEKKAVTSVEQNGLKNDVTDKNGEESELKGEDLDQIVLESKDKIILESKDTTKEEEKKAVTSVEQNGLKNDVTDKNGEESELKGEDLDQIVLESKDQIVLESKDTTKEEEKKAVTSVEQNGLKNDVTDKNGEEGELKGEDLDQIVLEFSSDSLADTYSQSEAKEFQSATNQSKETDGWINNSANAFAFPETTHTNAELMDTRTSFAEDFLEASVTALLPTEERVKSLGGPASWSRVATMILSLATRLFISHPVIHYLRACNDFVSLVLLPENLEPYALYYLGKLGEELAPEYLDSEESFEEVDKFLSSLELVKPERMHQFCGLFYGRCIETNPDTQLLYNICEKICSSDKSEGVTYMGPVMHRVFLNEEAFSPGIFNEIVKSSDNLNEEHPALMDIDNCLFNNENRDSHFAVLCCDLLCEVAFQNVDTENISGSEDETMKMFNQAAQVIFDKETKSGLILICAVAFLRSFLKSLATTVLQTQCLYKHGMLLHEVDALLVLKESTPDVNDRKFCAKLYLLKELRRLLSWYDLRRLCDTSLKMTCFKELQWSDSISMCKAQQYCLCNAAELSAGHDALVHLMENKDSARIVNFVSLATESFINKFNLIALITENFYFVRSIRSIKDTEIQAAKEISALVDARFPRPFSKAVEQLLGETDFHSPELQMDTSKSSIEVQRSVLILHLVGLVLSNLKQTGHSSVSTEPFSVYMLNPIRACKTYFLAGPTNKGFDVCLNVNSFSNPLYFCVCGTVFVSTATTGTPKCPNCKSSINDVKESKNNGSVLVAVKGYMPIDLKQMESNAITTRNLKPAVFRTIHLLVHAALFAGVALDLVEDKNLSIFLGGDENFKDPAQYCFGHFQNDLSVLSRILACSEERVITWIHNALHKTKHLFTTTSEKEDFETEAHRNTLESKFSQEIELLIPDVFRAAPSKRLLSCDHSSVKVIEVEADEEDAVIIAQEDKAVNCESFRPFFRITTPKSYEHLRSSYSNEDDITKMQHPVIGLFLDHSSDLSFLHHLSNLLKWPRKVESICSRRLSRGEAKDKSISEFVRGEKKGKNPGENRQLFDAFKQSWNEVRKVIAEGLETEEEEVPRISEMMCIGYCLVEERDFGKYLVAALKALQQKQNTFLEKILQVAALGKTSALSSLQRGFGESAIQSVHLQDAKEREFIQFEWTDDILRHCQNNTEYGCGREIIYDYDKIEKELVARFLLGKSYLTTQDGLRQFVFSKELFHACAGILNDIQQLIPQVPVTTHVRRVIFGLKEDSLKNVQDLLEHLEVVLCLLKRTKGDPDELLTKYTDKWLSMLPCPFPKYRLEECSDTIMLKHVVDLYQSLEDVLSEAAVDSIPDTYSENLDDETKKDLNKLVSINPEIGKVRAVDALRTALCRFTYRYLSSADFLPLPAEKISPCLKDPSLWPLNYAKADDVVPKTLLIGNLRPALDYLQKLSEDVQNRSRGPRTPAAKKGAARTNVRKRSAMFSFS